MKKNFFLFACLCLLFQVKTAPDIQPRLSSPTRELSAPQKMLRNILDFIAFENLGSYALREENEIFIKKIIDGLSMQNYAIEIRRLSYEGQKKVGPINAFAIETGYLSYLYVSEDWFDTLSYAEKQALIRHELMHIKKGHAQKKLNLYMTTSAMLSIITYLINNKIQMFPVKESLNNQTFNHGKLRQEAAQKALTLCLSNLSLLLITSKCSRMWEKEADIEALKSMPENKDGFISLFKNIQKHTEENKTSRFKIKQTLEYYLDPILRLLSTHPKCDERIAYIQEISEDLKG